MGGAVFVHLMRLRTAIPTNTYSVGYANILKTPSSSRFLNWGETDCAFWLHLKGEPIEVLGAYKGHKSRTPVLFDKERPALSENPNASAHAPEQHQTALLVG